MKKMYKSLSVALLLATASWQDMSAQGCSITATNNLYNWGCIYGDNIDDFELDGVVNISGCASNGEYTYFSSPAWTLQIGQTYTWQANVGSGFLDQGFALWIDLDNDGTFTSNEQLANSNYDVFHSGSFQVPFSATPGAAHRMRIRCSYFENIDNTNNSACEQYGPPNYYYYYGEMEDYDVYLLPAPPCSGTPAANSVVGPDESICPGTSAFLTLATTYTVGDITYQWQASTQSSLGAWTNVGSGSMNYVTSPITTDTWYQVIITCTNSSGSTVGQASQVLVQGVKVDSIPYLEDFEGIDLENELPNCSWDATNLGMESLTYTLATWDNRIPHSGDKFASFVFSPGNTNSFYSNGIYLHANTVYSASVWYTTDEYGGIWEDFSIKLGTSQSSSGQMVIASTPGQVSSSVYKPLSNTFTVGTTGVYYVGVEATGDANNWGYYLSWDDLQIIAPCHLNPVELNLAASQETICEGQPVTLTASGADSYSWDTGEKSNVLTLNPTASHVFEVTGTSSITGCSAQTTKFITVNPAPFVAIVASKQKVCPGEEVNLTAVGNAQNYVWSGTSQVGPFITVLPTSSSVYSLQGTNGFGCTSEAVISLTVLNAPLVNGSANNTLVCVGDKVVLSATGAQSYQWLSVSSFIQSNPAEIIASSSVQYTVIGTDANGCKAEDYVTLQVEGCAGLSENGRLAGVRVFPNPGTGIYTLQLPNLGDATLEVSDIVGRVVYSSTTHGNVKTVDISSLSNGVYYFNVRSGERSEVIRVLKN